jgi:hypothetical protein
LDDDAEPLTDRPALDMGALMAPDSQLGCAQGPSPG